MLSPVEIVNDTTSMISATGECPVPFIGCMAYQSNVNNVIILWFALSAVYHMVMCFLSMNDSEEGLYEEKVCWKKHYKLCASHRLARFYHCQRRCHRRRRKHASETCKKHTHDQCPISRLICSMPPPLPFHRRRKGCDATASTTELVEDEALPRPDKSVIDNVAIIDEGPSSVVADTSADETNSSGTKDRKKEKKSKSKKRRLLLQPTLLDMTRMQRWSLIEQRLQLTTKEAKRRDADGLMPLHWACSGAPPVSAVKALLEAYPKAARRVDGDGSTALHFASHYNSSIAVVETLLEAYPQAIRIQDMYGRTPLYHAVVKTAGLEVLRALVLAEPEMTTKPCIPPINAEEDPSRTKITQERPLEERTPLYAIWLSVVSSLRTRRRAQGRVWDKAVLLLQASYLSYMARNTKRNAADVAQFLSARSSQWKTFRLVHAAIALHSYLPEAVLPHLLDIHPEQVRETDDEGRLPLAIAASLKRVTSERSDNLIKLLVQAYPQAAAVVDSNGQSPIMLALASGKRWDSGVERLFRAAPDYLYRRDPVSGLYPALLAAASESPEMEEKAEVPSSNQYSSILDTQPSVEGKAFEWRRRIMASTRGNEENSTAVQNAVTSSSISHVSTIFELLQADPAVVRSAVD